MITGDASAISDGGYKSEIKFSSVLLPVTGAKDYKFGRYNNADLIWRILTVDDVNKRALLVTEKCVTRLKYANRDYNTWSTSNIRTWLNGTGTDSNGNQFFKEFSQEEKNKILSVDIEDGAGQTKNSSEILTSSGKDKIFLLSSADVYTYFKDNNDRIAYLGNDTKQWWLRSPAHSFNNTNGLSTTNVDVVSSSGGLVNDGHPASSSTSIYVRPALWLDFSSTEEKSSTATIGFTKTAPNNNSDENTEDKDKDKDKDEEDNSESKDEIITPAPGTEEPETNEKPTELNTDEIEDFSEEELKEKFGNTSNVVLSGDLSKFNGQKFADLIEKIENVTEIKILDLSNVTGLKEISLPESTKIQELNIENSKILTKIDVSNSNLTKLNTNGCENLASLNCSSCGIIELDIGGCVKLSELNCSYNCLARLNLSGFEKLDSLKCEHQNISGVKRVEKFNFVEFLFRVNSEIFLTNYSNELNRIKDLQAFNEAGEAITVNLDKNSGEIIFSEEPATIKYNYETNFENILMDVTVATSVAVEEDENNNDNNNGGGSCNFNGEKNSGLKIKIFAVFYVLFELIRRDKKSKVLSGRKI